VKFPIEHNGNQAFIVAGRDMVVEIEFGPMTRFIWPVPVAETIHVCAWHDSTKHATQRLTDAGFTVSHGICESCNKRMLEEVNKQSKLATREIKLTEL